MLTNSNERCSRGIKDNKPVISFGGRHVPLVTKPEFKHEVRSRFVAVLHKKAQRPFRYTARLATKRDAERVRVTGEKSGDGGKVETACTLPEIVIEKLTKLPASL